MKKWLLPICLLCIAVQLNAQQLHNDNSCGYVKEFNILQAAKGTVEDIAEHDYDVKYVHINLALNNTSTTLSGSVNTRAQVVNSAGMNLYVFELNPLLVIDSVTIDNITCPVNSNGYVRSVTLPATKPFNAIFNAEVYYHGTPTPAGRGINSVYEPQSKSFITYTLSEPYSASMWWPCKQYLRDKIDSADIWLTVDDTLKAGSNGRLQSIKGLPNGKHRFQWKTNYPMSYYLISLAVSTYQEYTTTLTFPQNNVTMPVQNYIYGDATTFSNWQPYIDSTNLMILYFSELWGIYPFYKEKYGHCMAPIGGGMEHQTMTTQSSFDTWLTAHELAHQWFGDYVTCASWKDIWLNEGWASYAEYLFYEKFQDAAAAKSKMEAVHARAKDSLYRNLSIYVDDTTNISRVFNSRITYNKASAVIHTLRYVMNDDTKFYDAIKSYLNQFQFSNATTEDFKQHWQTFTGRNWDTFFNQWIYQPGYPVFAVSWNQVNDRVVIKVNQSNVSAAGVPFFVTPLDIKLSGANVDTTVRMSLHHASETADFSWQQAITNLEVDPKNYLLDSVAAIQIDTSLGVTPPATIIRHPFLVAQNPTTNYWYITEAATMQYAELYDVLGRSIYAYHQQQHGVFTIDGGNLSSGTYYLNILDTSGKKFRRKLIKY